MALDLQTRRIYEPPAPDDGCRILIDRIWPRGISKEVAKLDHWAKDLAPSTELRRWYRHDPEKWDEFRRRYFAELDAMPEEVASLRQRIGERRATLVFASKEERRNNAEAMREYLERESGRR